ncbi:MAG TPA: ATP-binding protein, partial [Kofleriaceae bacterium]|nr:ATP-binding protein [Kofleriaceae bacterium]
DLVAAAAAAAAAHRSPLTVLVDRFALSAAEAALLAIACAYELDWDTRQLVHAIAGRKPALYVDLCAELDPALAGAAELLAALHPAGGLRRGLLVELTGEGAGAALALGRRALDWLLGDPRLAEGLAPVARLHPAGDDLAVHVDAAVRARIDEVADRLRAAERRTGEPAPLVLVQGAQGAGKLAVAHALATALDRPLLAAPIQGLIDADRRGERRLLPRFLAEARLTGALPYLAGVQALQQEEAAGARAAFAAEIDGETGPLLLSTRERGMPSLPFRRPFHLIRIPVPDLDVRRAAWSAGLGRLGGDAELGEGAADTLAARYVIGPGLIGEVVREARAFAGASGEPVRISGIEEAVGRRLTLRLGSFGQLISRRASFDEMVLPEDVVDTLRDMIAMVRQRARILEQWGYAKHLGISRGVSALFSGEPGTGKTMAASVISSELGLELVRVDLSAVVSKWVGETEKHLAKIFDEAQNANAMMVFDEADSLFGKRTEVKTAQDRFANLEVNYILQRMETFDGICVLTSNMEASIDPAFLRRLNFRVRFPEPDVDERIALWKKLLPPDSGLQGDIDYDRLATTFEMTGGHIKNAIVRAAVIAAREDRRMQPDDLVAGAHLGYLELGKVMPSLPRH